MSNNNTAPFRIGQEVVALNGGEGDIIQKGNKYTVNALQQLSCGCWGVDIGIKSENTTYFCDAHNSPRCLTNGVRWIASSFFAPVQYSDITASLASEAMKERVEVDVVREVITEKIEP